MTQVLLAIDFMHNVGIVHRDIKLDNILINRIDGGQYNVKIADFGLAMKLPGENVPVYEICGTPGYIAPEVLRN
jgi:serine/threonine protein kinase